MKKSKMLLALMLGTILSVQSAMAQVSHDNENVSGKFTDSNIGGVAGVFLTPADEDVSVKNSTYSNNGAYYDGGAIGHNGKGKMTVEGSTFSGNTAQYTTHNGSGVSSDTNPVGGGALSLGATSKTDVQKSTFTGNKSGRDGGAISTRHNGPNINNSGAQLSVSGSTFDSNEAKGSGGAIYNAFMHDANGGDGAKFEGNIFNGNTAGLHGGAFFNEAEAKASVSGTFTGNSAEDSGGAIFNVGNITVGGTFEGNSARYSGGAISNQQGGSLTVLDGSIFRGNKTLWEPRTSNDYPKRASEMGTIYSEGTKDKAAKVTIGDNVTFENNTAGGGAGLFLYGNNEAKIGDNVTFSGNKALEDKDHKGGTGGAIAIVSGEDTGEVDLTIGDNATFDGNTADGEGGAISVRKHSDKAQDSKLSIGTNATFKNNKTTSETRGNGGAIYSDGNTSIGEGAKFVNNSAAHFGGGIYNVGTEQLNLINDDFTGNTAQRGGAVYGGKQSTTHIEGGTYSGNSAIGSKDDEGNPIYGQGGAIFTERGGADSKPSLNVDGATFDGNSAENEGGAIWSGASTSIDDSIFKNNKTTGTAFHGEKPNYHSDSEGGGAIFVGSNSEVTIGSSQFVGNSSATVGGAIATRSNAIPGEKSPSSLSIEGSTFSGNSAAKNGGAIASYVDVDIKDSSFTGNSAGEKGGAVWANSNVTVTATEKGSDVVFSGNSAKDGGDIFMDSLEVEGSSTEAKIGDLKFVSESDRNITLADGISGKDTYKVTKQGEGTLTFNGEIKNANMTVETGTLHLAEGNSIVNSTITMSDGTTLDTTDGAFTSYAKDAIKTDSGVSIKLKADISSATGKTDSFSGITGKVTLEDFNPVADTLLSRGSITTEELKKSLGLGDGATLSFGTEAKEDHIFLSPLRYLNAKANGSGISFAPTGSGYRDFNPAVMASPVAAQIGGYLNQLNSYDEAFRNMDMYMLMTKKQRKALKLKNQYAAADGNLIFDPTNTPYDEKAAWFRPYATFENVSLKGGPKVSNVAYGTYFGAESELKELGHGWDGMYGVYAGYNGSHQAYDGIGIYQNGGTLGLVGMAYKGNFFTGLTVNAGANVGEAHTYYGQDNFTMMLAGVANKTGYNWELAEGKFIIQPSLMTSYSFVNTFDYTNASGIRIDSDAMHVVTFEPGLKFIGNLKNGWQPYAGVSFVWNILDKTQFQANDASLPELSIKPFVRYGIGVRKTWGERLTGFFQTFFTNGGRNGVGFQLGFRMTLGKGGKAIQKGHTPELPKTVLKVGNR